MLKTKMQEWVEKEMFHRKGLVILEVTDEMYRIYKTRIKNNEGDSVWTCRKKLTRNFILGTEIKRHHDNEIIRAYGNLKIRVTNNIVTGLINDKGYTRGYINEVEKEELDKIYKIGVK